MVGEIGVKVVVGHGYRWGMEWVGMGCGGWMAVAVEVEGRVVVGKDVVAVKSQKMAPKCE